VVMDSAYGAERPAHRDLRPLTARRDLDGVHELPDHAQPASAQAFFGGGGPRTEVTDGEEQLAALALRLDLERIAPRPSRMLDGVRARLRARKGDVDHVLGRDAALVEPAAKLVPDECDGLRKPGQPQRKRVAMIAERTPFALAERVHQPKRQVPRLVAFVRRVLAEQIGARSCLPGAPPHNLGLAIAVHVGPLFFRLPG
jgi:hypothetical protein